MWPLFRRWLSPPLLLLVLLAVLQCTSAFSHSSSPARKLLAASVPAKSRSDFPAVINLRDILAGLEESSGPKAVEVTVHSDDSQRAAVVVSVKISDLFPEEGSSHSGPQHPAVGKKRLLVQSATPADPAPAGAAAAAQPAGAAAGVPVAEVAGSAAAGAAAGGRQPAVRGLTGKLDVSVLPGVTTWLEGASLADQKYFKKLTGREGGISSSGSGGSSSGGGGSVGSSSSSGDSSGGSGTGGLTLSDIPLGRRKLLSEFAAQGHGHSSGSSSRKLLAGIAAVQPAAGVASAQPAVQPAAKVDKPATQAASQADKAAKEVKAEQNTVAQPVKGASGVPDDAKQDLAALGVKRLTPKTQVVKIEDLGLPDKP